MADADSGQEDKGLVQKKEAAILKRYMLQNAVPLLR